MHAQYSRYSNLPMSKYIHVPTARQERRLRPRRQKLQVKMLSQGGRVYTEQKDQGGPQRRLCPQFSHGEKGQKKAPRTIFKKE